MKHCHISIICNELPFLKQKLPFLYEHFEQIIFIDYNIYNKCNSTDGTIEYIENFYDPTNKITLIKFTESNLKQINNFNGVSMIEKQKMFALGSKYIKDEINIIWATDMDEFFNNNLIKIVENEFTKDDKLITIDIPEMMFVYNQFNIFKGEEKDNSTYVCPARITKHFKNKIYGHCNFSSYGKTIKCNKEYIYHFAWVGVNRVKFKSNIYNKSNNSEKNKINEIFLKIYLDNLKENNKYINIYHTNKDLKFKSIKYTSELYPKYIDINTLINELNSSNN